MNTEGQDYKRTAYRANEVAELLGLNRSTVYAMMSDGRLGYSVFCGIRFIARSDIPGIGNMQTQETTSGNNETMSQNNDLTSSL
jgi:excisionase family DNA binding protein